MAISGKPEGLAAKHATRPPPRSNIVRMLEALPPEVRRPSGRGTPKRRRWPHIRAAVLEYEAAAKKNLQVAGLSSSDVDAIIDYICRVANHFKVYYLWRPFLRDPRDDMVLELAASSFTPDRRFPYGEAQRALTVMEIWEYVFLYENNGGVAG